MKDVKIGLIPAAGRGNRISELPLTRVLPKPMLPILNKPILDYVIGNMVAASVKVIYVVVGHKKEIIKEYLGSTWGHNIEVHYIEQEVPKGIAHAIGLAERYIHEPFIVILGDDFTIGKSVGSLIEAFWRNEAWAVEGVVVEENTQVLRETCCVITDTDGNIIDIEEKPQKPMSNLRGCGLYIFDPIVFDYIQKTLVTPPRNEKEITNTLKLMAKEGKAFGVPIDGVNFNINTSEDLVKATALTLRFLGVT